MRAATTGKLLAKILRRWMSWTRSFIRT
jgi:hypothetical protein